MEYRVTWIQCPTAHHTPRVLFVEAANGHDASVLAKDHVERTFGIIWFNITGIDEARAVPAGKVKEAR